MQPSSCLCKAASNNHCSTPLVLESDLIMVQAITSYCLSAGTAHAYTSCLVHVELKIFSFARDICPLLQGDIDDDTFRQYFEQFGDIDDCVVSTSHLIASLARLSQFRERMVHACVSVHERLFVTLPCELIIRAMRPCQAAYLPLNLQAFHP